MKIKSAEIKNFRSVFKISKLEFSDMTVFIGKNDSGKSNILLALDRFFKGKFLGDDLNKKNKEEGFIEISFELKENENIYLDSTKVETTLLQENLLNSDGNLDVIVKIGRQKNPLVKYFLRILDFEEGTDFFNLTQKGEEQLNPLLTKNSLSFSEEKKSVKSGKGRENKQRREILRNYATQNSFYKKEQEILLDEDSPTGLRDEIIRLINTTSFHLYAGNTPLEVAESEHQSKFKPLVELVINDKIPADLNKNINDDFQKEINEIESIFQKDTGMDLKFKSDLGEIEWQKAIKPAVQTTEDDFIISLDKRGLGTQRLFIMAMFRYLAKRLPAIKGNKFNQFLFAIEEPEAFLHNDLQRKFLHSMQKLAKEDPQIILTTHSAIFSRFSDCSRVYLTTFDKKAGTQVKNIDVKNDYLLIKKELGAWNNDIFFDNALFCIEGDTEEKVFPYIFQKINCSCSELGIRLINLKGQNKIDKDKIKELFKLAKDHGIKVCVFLDKNEENEKTKCDICKEFKELFPENEKDKLFKIWSNDFIDCFPKEIIISAFKDYRNDPSLEVNICDRINKCNNQIENELKMICHENSWGDFEKPRFGECIGRALQNYNNEIEIVSTVNGVIEYIKNNL